MIMPEKAIRSHSFIFSNLRPLKIFIDYVCAFEIQKGKPKFSLLPMSQVMNFLLVIFPFFKFD